MLSQRGAWGKAETKSPAGRAGLSTTSRPIQANGWHVNVSSCGRQENEKPREHIGRLWPKAKRQQRDWTAWTMNSFFRGSPLGTAITT